MAQVPWLHKRCILCLAQRDLTVEHIIPRQIGGRLTARFLCKFCNDQLGHKVEADVRADPSIRMAAENLRNNIPDLAKAIREGQPYIASGPGGKRRGSFKGNAFRIDGARHGNEFVVPIDDKHLQRVLAKRGLTQDAIVQQLYKFKKATANTTVRLDLGLHATRWEIDEIRPALNGPFLSSAVLAKIAYEYLACHAGELVLSEAPELAGLRAAIRGDNNRAIEIERLTTRNYRPLHGLAMAECDGHAVVSVCLFGWLVFRVHLLAVALRKPYFTYTCKLDTGDESWEVS